MKKTTKTTSSKKIISSKSKKTAFKKPVVAKKATKSPAKKSIKKSSKKAPVVKQELNITEQLIDISLEGTDGCDHDAAWNLLYAATSLMHYTGTDIEMFDDMVASAREALLDMEEHDPSLCNECIAELEKEKITNNSLGSSPSNVSSPSITDEMRNKLN